jgi:hypothetical protein
MAGAAALIEFLGKGECKSRKYSVMLGEVEVEIARGGAWSLEIMSALIMADLGLSDALVLSEQA